jgi:predicted nucleic acid-binding Zn finger protein
MMEADDDAGASDPLTDVLEGLAQVGGGNLALDDVVLRAVSFMMPGEQDKLDNALQILESGRLRLATAPSGRQLYIVSGSNRKQYLCMPNHYCSCESYYQMARKSSDTVMCKHLLALRLAPFLSGAKHVAISDEELANLLGSD